MPCGSRRVGQRERLWRHLVIKNLALQCIVAPIGFILCALPAWRVGDTYPFSRACAPMVCMILLWLGVGNALPIVLPVRDKPIRQRKEPSRRCPSNRRSAASYKKEITDHTTNAEMKAFEQENAQAAAKTLR